MSNVFLIKYRLFNHTNKLDDDEKCDFAGQFNNTTYNY